VIGDRANPRPGAGRATGAGEAIAARAIQQQLGDTPIDDSLAAVTGMPRAIACQPGEARLAPAKSTSPA